MGLVVRLWPRSRPETRSADFTQRVVNSLFSSSSIASSGNAIAALETVARFWGLGLASASISPASPELASISPSVLDAIGRSLCRSGESLHVIEVRDGQATLTPCSNWTVLGSYNPQTWRYQVTLNGPSTAQTFTLPAASVVHIRYAPDPSRPWVGRSPMTLAIDTTRAAGLLETATAGELNFTQRQVLTPRRNQGDYSVADSLGPETIQKIVTAFTEHTNAGCFVIPADVEPRRLGPEPPDSFPLLRDRLENSILAMHGIPPALVFEGGTGVAMREAFRQVLHSLLRPLGLLVVEELKLKLDPAAAMSFDALRAGDITGSARAFGSLVKSGLTPQSAARIVGLDDVEVSA